MKPVPPSGTQRRSPRRNDRTVLLLMLADLLWAGIAYGSAFSLRVYLPFPLTADFLPASRFTEVAHPLLFLLGTQLGLLYFFGLYDQPALHQRARLATRVATALGIQLLATAAWYFFRGDLSFPRSVLVVFWVFNSLGIIGLRLWVAQRLGHASPVRILLIGLAQDVRMFLSSLTDLRPSPGLDVVGAIGLEESACQTPEEAGIPWLGRLDSLPQVLEQVEIDEVILLSSASWKDTFVDRLLNLPSGHLAAERPRVLVVPSVYDILVGRVSSLRLHDVPLVEVLKNPREELAFVVKSISDRLIAGVLLVLCVPLVGVAAGLVKLSSSGPVLYRQRRVGRHGKEFTLYKLRTMVHEAEARTGPVLARSDDSRVTPVGRLLRASRIDEIPQLFNVLNGSMSLVGPRPERPEFVAGFQQTIPGYAERLQVKPGLTGLAQVNGEYHTTPEYKLKYDLAYIYNYSLWLDVRVLTETVKVILTRRGV